MNALCQRISTALLILSCCASVAASPSSRTRQADEWRDPRTGMLFRFVPAGKFVMGRSADTLEKIRLEAQLPGSGSDFFNGEAPPRIVETAGYWIGKHEVTMDQYARFLRAVPRASPPSFPGSAAEVREARLRYAAYVWNAATRRPPSGRGQHPVVLVTLAEMRAFCTWAGYRLPTEAEWEKAAGWDPAPERTAPPEYPSLLDWEPLPGWKRSAGAPRGYPWGNVWHWWTNCAERHWQGYLQTHGEWSARWLEHKIGILGSNSAAEARVFTATWTSPVGTFPEDRSPYGCVDMAGNVSEVCTPFLHERPTAGWVSKGGSFDSPWWECRVSARRPGGSLPSLNVGFRCVLTKGPT